MIDFYQHEFNYLNPNIEQDAKKTVLIIGDSFSTHPDNYINILRERNPNWRYINATISGTGIKQHRLYIKNKIEKFQPDHVIYQFYVGNDLLDIRHPINFKTLSFLRNSYWKVSEQLLFLQYLNFKLAGLKSNLNPSIEILRKGDFNVVNYNHRTKIHFSGNPSYLKETIAIEETAFEAYTIWKSYFAEILNCLPSSTKVSLLLIPHCVQVNEKYLKRMIQLGANLNDQVLQPSSILSEQMKRDFPNIEPINLQDYFRQKEESEKQLYYNNDPHLNSEGQLAIANYLFLRGI